MINAYWEPLTFQLPALDPDKSGWRLWVDTSESSPHDIHGWNDTSLLTGTTYMVGPRSIVVLAAA